jgi:hypothetical protein
LRPSCNNSFLKFGFSLEGDGGHSLSSMDRYLSISSLPITLLITKYKIIIWNFKPIIIVSTGTLFLIATVTLSTVDTWPCMCCMGMEDFHISTKNLINNLAFDPFIKGKRYKSSLQIRLRANCQMIPPIHGYRRSIHICPRRRTQIQHDASNVIWLA